MEGSNTGTPSTGSSGAYEPAKKYGKPDPNNKNNWTCIFCGKVTKGGVYRLKQHLVGGFRNALKCPSCPEHVREKVKDFMIKKAQDKANSQMMPNIPQFDHGVDDDGEREEEDCEIVGSSGKRSRKTSNLPKKPRHKGPLDMFITSTPKDILQGRKERNGIFGVCDKELREKTCRHIARWFYDAGIAFNAVNYESFGVMIEAIGQYGPGLKPPSMYELRVHLLNKEVEDTNKQMEEHKKELATKGSSILSDGWRDSVAQKDIVNFLVNSPRGSIFIKSMDVSEVVKDATLLFQMLDDMVEEVGEANVIQVVTDNASNYVKAGKK
ncbi:uncharacterized protein [Spinacia oleracea]|uniref:BED-type domain-containing protein n=1 Tax=Spinacia oleracea TaxID=3562 RepID=A0A9R0HSI7_SPIOL|nr:uncharacterized protein LOC110775898 [Spinacia oleracea]